MKRLSLLLTALAFAAGGPAFAQDKKLLLITESRGFRHGVVTRKVTIEKGVDPKTVKAPGLEINFDKKGNANASYSGRVHGTQPVEIKEEGKTVAKVEPCQVEVTFQELGKKHGFHVTCSQDSRTELTGDNLKEYDAVWFYTTGELPLSDGQKSDLLGFVKSGKGFGGSHSAADTNYKWKEYGDLVGAYFAGHPPGYQDIVVTVKDKQHPATKHLPESFKYKDEIYQYRAPGGDNKAKLPDTHVLLSIDMDATAKNQWRADKDNRIAWTRDYGKGRVFYTALGHGDHVWRDPLYQQHVVGGLRYLFRQDGDSGEK